MVEIGHAEMTDAPALAPLIEQLGYPVLPDEVAPRLAGMLEEGAVILVARDAGRAIGWATVREVRSLTDAPHAELSGLVVASDRRGAGIGTRLLEAAEQWACERGFARLRLRANMIRTDAHRLYDRCGFSRTKVQQVFDKRIG